MKEELSDLELSGDHLMRRTFTIVYQEAICSDTMQEEIERMRAEREQQQVTRIPKVFPT